MTDKPKDINTPLRMWIALKILRAWNHGTEGYDGEVVQVVNTWIDNGIEGPMLFPKSPFFREWAKANGLSEVQGGYIGFRLSMERGKG